MLRTLVFCDDGLPVDDGIPEHALVATIQIAVKRIEVSVHKTKKQAP